MASDNTSIYVISLVAVVAVVGLVTMFLDGNAGAQVSADGSVIGHAVHEYDVSEDGAERGPRIIAGEKDKEYKPEFKDYETRREEAAAR